MKKAFALPCFFISSLLSLTQDFGEWTCRDFNTIVYSLAGITPLPVQVRSFALNYERHRHSVREDEQYILGHIFLANDGITNSRAMTIFKSIVTLQKVQPESFCKFTEKAAPLHFDLRRHRSPSPQPHHH